MIHALKQSSFSVSKQLGLTGLVAHSEWRRRRLLILCYHGVSLDDEHRWDPQLYVPPSHLERRLQLLERNDCTILPLNEAVERLYRGDLPNRAVALTFDDGYYDFMARAWPLLQAHQAPATVYLTTARVQHNSPIVNLAISYTLWRARDRVLDGDGLIGLSGSYPLAHLEQRQRVFRDMDAQIQSQGVSASDKDAIVGELAARLGVDYQELAGRRLLTLMRAEEVQQMARAGVDFQLHTHLHRTPLDADVFVRDVLRNRDVIEEMTGIRADHLCYPSGVYRSVYLPALQRAGVVSATTCDPGMADRNAERLLLPRFVDTCAVSDLEFEAWVTGIASCLPRRTRKAHPALN
jgi:peptidoglycan/xylan/chitin deacetylase (PgdA/CDA1 family)